MLTLAVRQCADFVAVSFAKSASTLHGHAYTQCACSQDWLDIDFAIRERVDFIAVSFVKSADVIKNLKSYLTSRADKVPALRLCMKGNKSCSHSALESREAMCDPFAHRRLFGLSVWVLCACVR